MSDVTLILEAIERGEPQATEKLFPVVYNELRRLAAAKLAREDRGQTLQPTALVHEAYLRLVDGDRAQVWNSRGHFFAAAAEAMRRILVDHARHKTAARRGGKVLRCEWDEASYAAATPPEEVIAVHESLDQFAAQDQLAAELVKLHYFGGFPLEEAAELLGMSRATGYRMWTYARAWLRASLENELGSRGQEP
jgi:RNA polymerase sigma factor (TIGR02999 family)